jgi:diguanylate cyclase (GGDEF)-like protein
VSNAASSALKQLFIPNGILVLAIGVAAAVFTRGQRFADFLLPISVLLICGGLLLSARFHSLRAFLAFAALGGQTLVMRAGPADAAFAYWSVALLVFNVGLLLLVDDTFFDWAAIGWWSGVLMAQWIALFALAKWGSGLLMRAATYTIDVRAIKTGPLEIALAVVALGMLGRFLWRPEPVSAGLFWTIVAVFPVANGSDTLYAATAALIIGISVLERSHFIAYRDELTRLPGRRAFNEELASLEEGYCIAVVDVDHFKKFNDTYGHDTGDQVLCKVANHLSRVAGGGKAFRCGGEEFAIVFRQGGIQEAATYLDELREGIAADDFVVRGPDRRHVERRERRSSRRGKHSRSTRTSVTVSIGVAAGRAEVTPQDVVKAADEALYKAKDGGRNRVEVAEMITPRLRVARASVH